MLLSGSVTSAGGVLADGDTDKGSPIGLFIVLILIVAVYFLYRSMSRHINRLPENFSSPEGSGPARQPQQAPPAGSTDAQSPAGRAHLEPDGEDTAARRLHSDARDTPQP